MNFTWPPIIERELRLAARRAGTYWNRVGAATSAAVVFFWVMSVQLASRSPLQAGTITFRVLVAIAAFQVVAGVVRLTSATFAREKRQDTLGLLFLTPLAPSELVLGKLLSSSLVAFSRFVAIVPLLALPLLMGAVAWQNVVLLLLAVASLTFLGATLGLYVSALSWDERRAARAAGWAMLGLVAGVPAVCLLIGTVLFGRQATMLLAASPAYAVWAATVPGAPEAPTYWISAGLALLLGWWFLRSTIRCLPTCWRSSAPTRREWLHGAEPLEEQIQAPRTPGPATAISRAPRTHRVWLALDEQIRAQLLDRNPVLWLARRWRADSTTAWIFGSLAVAGLVVVMIVGNLSVLIGPPFALFACICINTGLKIHMATQAGFALARDRGEDTLDLLVATPLTPQAVVQGHLHSIWEPLRLWLPRVIGIEVFWLGIAIAQAVMSRDDLVWCWVLLALGTLGFLLPDLRAIAWAGLWHGVVARNTRAAQHAAFGAVLLLPLLGVMLSVNLVAAMSDWKVSGAACAITWILPKVLIDWALPRRHQRRLLAELPHWAQLRAEGITEDYSGWRKLGRLLGKRWRSVRQSFS